MFSKYGCESLITGILATLSPAPSQVGLMMTPYLQIDLSKLRSNAKTLVTMLGAKGIDITCVTKSFLGEPRIADCLVSAGISSLGDSRIENIIRMKEAWYSSAFHLDKNPLHQRGPRCRFKRRRELQHRDNCHRRSFQSLSRAKYNS